MNNMTPINFIIMANNKNFDACCSKSFKVFDLKGSEVRKYNEKE